MVQIHNIVGDVLMMISLTRHDIHPVYLNILHTGRVNTLRPKQNGLSFENLIFSTSLFLNEICWILMWISLKSIIGWDNGFDTWITRPQWVVVWEMASILSWPQWVNPLRAKFFRGNINIYLHFASFLHINMAQVVEILPQIRQEPTYSTWSVSWLLMSWRRKEPGHQQPWYWPS